MIINDLDGYYIVFDTKNWNTELDTLLNRLIMSFKAEQRDIDYLLSNKLYEIPRNQRRYVWNKDNWEDLFLNENNIVVEN